MSRVIQNAEALAENELRRDALTIAEAGFAAIHTETVVNNKVQVIHGELHIADKKYKIAGRNIFYVGVGKCAIVAGRAIEKVLGDALTAGIAMDIADKNPDSHSKIETRIGTHPLPSEANVRATERILDFLAGRREDDLVLMLISGGGSTLLCSPRAPMTCIDERTLFEELTARGAAIQDINTVRKHLSRARGGALAKAAYPAEVVSLIVSDVPGDDLAFIASGPTLLDTSTVADAEAVLARYGVMPPAGIEFIETPKEQIYFKRVTNMLFLASRDALSAMKEEAEKRGYGTTIVDDQYTGEARDLGRSIVERLHTAPTKTALLYAGESTVTISGDHGTGGRNQEMALATVEYLNPDELILSFASDGHDNTDYAGAIADEATRVHALSHALSPGGYLDGHRSYDFFAATGDALITGYTGSNVSDLIIALKK